MCMVMVVDDQQEVCNLVGILLRYAGHEAICVNGGQSALDALKDNTPSLMLLDVMMPEMSGLDVLSALRQNPAHRDIPVVMLTAVSDDKIQDEARKLGAVDYLVKGTDWEEMLARIERYLPKAAVPDS